MNAVVLATKKETDLELDFRTNFDFSFKSKLWYTNSIVCNIQCHRKAWPKLLALMSLTKFFCFLAYIIFILSLHILPVLKLSPSGHVLHGFLLLLLKVDACCDLLRLSHFLQFRVLIKRISVMLAQNSLFQNLFLLSVLINRKSAQSMLHLNLYIIWIIIMHDANLTLQNKKCRN